MELPLTIFSIFLNLELNLQKLSNFTYTVASSMSKPIAAPNLLANIV